MFEFEKLFEQADIVERHLAAPFLLFRLAYLSHRSQQGTKRYTLRMIALAQLAIFRYLEIGKERQVPLAAVAAAAEHWAAAPPTRRGGNDSAASRRLAGRAAGWLRFGGPLERPSLPQPHSDYIADSVAHMRQERGFLEAAILSFRCRAEEFLRRFRGDDFTLADVTRSEELDLLRKQWCAQPSVHSGKSARIDVP